jgi:hypothetical protein
MVLGILVEQEFHSSRLKLLFQHYRECGRPGQMPRRSDIDPSRMIRAMPNTYIVTVERGERGDTEFLLQLFGTELVYLFNAELTGERICKVDLGDWGLEWRSTLRYAMRTQNPVVAIHRLEIAQRLPIEIEHLALPLSTDGATVDRLIGAIDLLSTDRAALSDELSRIEWSSTRKIGEDVRVVLSYARSG